MQLDLRLGRAGRWFTRWREEELFLYVAGPDEAPDAGLVAALQAVVDRWPEVRAQVTRFAAALAPDAHIPLEPASWGGFRAGDCGFQGKLWFGSISAPDPAQPARVEVTFSTGEPDGYASFRAELIDGVITGITAFAS